MKATPHTEVKLKVASTLEDRSDLSDEMTNLCAKLPIYRVAEGEVDLSSLNQTTDVLQMPDLVQTPDKRKKILNVTEASRFKYSVYMACFFPKRLPCVIMNDT